MIIAPQRVYTDHELSHGITAKKPLQARTKCGTGCGMANYSSGVDHFTPALGSSRGTRTGAFSNLTGGLRSIAPLLIAAGETGQNPSIISDNDKTPELQSAELVSCKFGCKPSVAEHAKASRGMAWHPHQFWGIFVVGPSTSRCGGQVVRQWIATPPFVGSIPTRISKHFMGASLVASCRTTGILASEPGVASRCCQRRRSHGGGSIPLRPPISQGAAR